MGVWSGVEETFKDTVAFSENAIDNAISAASEISEKAKTTFECHHSMMKFDAQAWIDSAVSSVEDVDIFDHPHHKPPHHDPPHHKRPHHGHGHHAPNKTVYAPTDKAFEKLPKGHKKPSKELIKKVLAYHVSPDFYPAGRVLVTHTIPTALGEDSLGGNPQRLRVGINLFYGLSVNFYSRIVAVNIFGTNGVIHGVDSLILPPPPAYKIIELVPSEFSTLELALVKTGLDKALADAPHA